MNEKEILSPDTPYEQDQDKPLSEGEHKPNALRIGDILEWINDDNLALRYTEDELHKLGNDSLEEYRNNCNSNSDRRDRIKMAEKLAKVQSVKDSPELFEGAADVVIPMLSEVLIQHESRMFLLFVKDREIAKHKIIGKDDELQTKAKKAARRTAFHSNYMIEVMKWDGSLPGVLMQQANCGAFKKIYYDPGRDRIVSDAIPTVDFVVDSYAKQMEDNGKAHVYTLYPHQIVEYIRAGAFCDFDYGESGVKKDEDEGSGVSDSINSDSNKTSAHKFIEHYRRIDLDKDGYPEPYILTIHDATQKIVRIKACFDESTVFVFAEDGKKSNGKRIPISLAERIGKKKPKKADRVVIARIDEYPYFVQYKYYPSPDGGFYGMGLGEMMAPMNKDINGFFSRIADAGTLANMQRGFVSKSVKTPDGSNKLEVSLNGFNQIDCDMQELKNAFFILPPTQISPVLLTVADQLIQLFKEWAGSTNIMSGQMPSSDARVGTVLALIEQGMQKLTAVAKSTYMSIQEEIRLVWRLLQKYKPGDLTYIDENGQKQTLEDGDLDDDGMIDIVPVADPADLTNQLKLMRNQAVLQVLGIISQAGGNVNEIIHQYLEDLGHSEIDKILPKETQPPPNPEMLKLQVESARLQLESAKFEFEVHKAASDYEEKMIRLEMEIHKTGAEIKNTLAQSVKNTAEAEAKEVGQQVEQYSAQVEELQKKHQAQTEQLGVYQKYIAHLRSRTNQNENAGVASGTSAGMALQPGNQAVYPGMPGQVESVPTAGAPQSVA